MEGINATMIATKVVNDQSGRDRPDEVQVTEPVRSNSATVNAD